METKLKALRDILTTLIGGFGLIHSQLTGVVYPELLPVFIALVGLPTVLRLSEARKNGGSGSTGQTD